MSSRALMWSGYALVLAVGFTAMVLLTNATRSAEIAEAEARADAALGENLRLALWRLDTSLVPLILDESLRPVNNYLLDSKPVVENTATEPLPLIRRFEWSLQGQKSEQSLEPIVTPFALTPADFTSLWKRVSEVTPETFDSSIFRQNSATIPPGDSFSMQNSIIRSNNEYAQRRQNLEAGNQAVFSKKGMEVHSEAPLKPLTPIWHGEDLLLVRRIEERGRERLQGCHVNWQKLVARMTVTISDLLPQATFVKREDPATNADQARQAVQTSSLGSTSLAAIPVRLLPPSHSLVSVELPRFSWALWVAWLGAIATAVAGGMLLAGISRLSERRAAFVSAVTHELRTPLTTFQIYTEMLTAGMVREQGQRQQYLETLRSESLRLNHLVENVLAFSRMERGRPFSARESISIGELFSRMLVRLEQSLIVCSAIKPQDQKEGPSLELAIDSVAQERVKVNPSLVEQILLNLIDNACKYAVTAIDRRILIQGSLAKGTVELRVRDFGPGFPASRWWRPFRKSVEQAAESAPGIGLGLSLSRRLAKQFGGRLRHEKSAQGACLVLSLPLATG